jgi:cytochrome c553
MRGWRSARHVGVTILASEVPTYRTGVSCAAHADPVKQQLMGIPLLRMIAGVGGVTCILAMTGCARSSVAASISGAELFEACAPCHGPAGEGKVAVGAPAIAGLPAWYVAAQLERFQTGVRGRHGDDVEGLRMQAMSRQLRSEIETNAVAAHVASLPQVTNTAIGGGDAVVGMRGYVLCASCHGVTGEGFEAGRVPPLAGMNGWYVAAQIRKFQNGVRGAIPGDAFGPVMRAVAEPLSAGDINEIAAYVDALSGERGTLR